MEEPHRRRRWVLAACAVPFLVLAAVRFVAPDDVLPMIWVSSGTVWAFLPAWGLLALALLRKDRLAATLSGLVVLCHLAWIVPTLVPASGDPGDGANVRVVAANVLYVNQTPEILLEELLATDADVLVLEEVSPRWQALLETERVHAMWPHREMMVRPDAFGIAVLARHPIRDAALVDLMGVPMVDATVDIAGRDVRVLGVHTLPPVDSEYADVWRAQLAQLRMHVGGIDEPLIVAGDLNGTLHNGGVRALREAGVTDVHDALGRGLDTTWPNGVFSAPPLALDHVLVSRHFTPRDVRIGQGAGSDHRPIVADLALGAS